MDGKAFAQSNLGVPVAVYEYGPNLAKARYADKKFLWFHRSNEKWISGRDGIEPPLYGADRLGDDVRRSVYLVEGEKDTDRLHAEGLLAVSTPDGANKPWKDAWSPTLAGRVVIVLGDWDIPGRKHAKAVVSAVTGVAAAVVDFLDGRDKPPRPKGKDVSDWLDAGLTVEEIEREAALAIKAAPASPPLTISFADFKARTYTAEPDLVKGLLPRQGITTLTASAWVGKTTIALGLAVAVATATPFFGFDVPEKVPVLFAELEGSPSTFQERAVTVARSLDFADVPGLSFANGIPPDLTPESPKLRQMIQESGAGFVVIDPLAYLYRAEENSNTEMKNGLFVPLNALAEEFKCCFLLLHHWGKSSEQRQGHERSRGASTLRDLSYTDMSLEMAKDGTERRLFQFTKIKDHPPVEPKLLRFDGPGGVFVEEAGDVQAARLPNLAAVKKIITRPMRTKIALAEIGRDLHLEKTAAKALLKLAVSKGCIRKPGRGFYAPVDEVRLPLEEIAPSEAGGEPPF